MSPATRTVQNGMVIGAAAAYERSNHLCLVADFFDAEERALGSVQTLTDWLGSECFQAEAQYVGSLPACDAAMQTLVDHASTPYLVAVQYAAHATAMQVFAATREIARRYLLAQQAFVAELADERAADRAEAE